MIEPSKEALSVASWWMCTDKRQDGDPDDGVYLALAIDALCAERVKESGGLNVLDGEYSITTERATRRIATLTSQRDRLKEALNQILTYATVRGLDYEPTEIARAALKEVSDGN